MYEVLCNMPEIIVVKNEDLSFTAAYHQGANKMFHSSINILFAAAWTHSNKDMAVKMFRYP